MSKIVTCYNATVNVEFSGPENVTFALSNYSTHHVHAFFTDLSSVNYRWIIVNTLTINHYIDLQGFDIVQTLPIPVPEGYAQDFLHLLRKPL